MPICDAVAEEQDETRTSYNIPVEHDHNWWDGDLPNRNAQYASTDRDPKRCSQEDRTRRWHPICQRARTTVRWLIPLVERRSNVGCNLPPAEHDEKDVVGRNCSGKEREGHECGERCEGNRDAPARMRLVRLEDMRTAEPCGVQLRVDARRSYRHTHVRSTKLHIYPGCWGEYTADQASKGIRDVDQTACGTHPMILVKYTMNGAPERTIGTCTSVNP